jgi:hypothetical protein
MKRSLTLLLGLCALPLISFSQSTAARVYEILQDNCASCHSHNSPAAGLDLEGGGATLAEQMQDVYTNLVGGVPANSTAADAGWAYVEPGRADKSFLFRKINQNLDPFYDLPAGAGAPMPKDQPAISELERELIRQWIQFGAPATGEVVEEALLEDYFSGAGEASFPVAPAGPAPAEGFQLKMGPIYLHPAGEPGDEVEYFQKYALDLPEDTEVHRIEFLISGYSHHFILYDFDFPGAAQSIPPGLRLDPFHQDVGLIAAVQEATDLRLPEGTAFPWEQDLVLDFNSHYINYSANLVYQAEVYINVYTQPEGTAIQPMQTTLLTNTNIPIPNNGEEITHSQVVTSNGLGEIFIWGIMGHTHQYGTDYKVYRRESFQQQELIYDGACAEGIPGCVSPFFDYQHIPMRYFDELLPLDMSGTNGFIHKASWINDGPVPVNFGPTSDDEMMVLVMMYTLDSTGIVIASDTEVPLASTSLEVRPNPVQQMAEVVIPDGIGSYAYRLTDLRGQVVASGQDLREPVLQIFRHNWAPGMYVLEVVGEKGQRFMSKVLVGG